MPLHKDIAPVGSDTGGDHNDMRALWEVSPCAMSLWNLDRSFCLLNQSAQRLTNYTETDFLKRHSLWVERIHPDDRQSFTQSQTALMTGKSPVQCDYRFLPRNAYRPVWLRENSILDIGRSKGPWDVLSVYIDISDLKANNMAGVKEDDLISLVKRLNHELSNCIQKAVLELEIAKFGLEESAKSSDLVMAVDAVNRSLLSLRDQLVSVRENLAPHDPSTILDVTVQRLRKELHRRRVNLQLVRRGPLPMVRGDKNELLSAFEKVFEVCGAMSRNGGKLEVEAGPKEVAGQLYAEVKVISSSAASFGPNDRGAFEGYGEGESHQIGLGIALAAEILGRYHGQVYFRREGKKRGEVTILIEASPS